MELPRGGAWPADAAPVAAEQPDAARRRCLAGASGPIVIAYRAVASAFHGLYAHNAFETAASIAFWFFLSLIPLLVFVGWMLGALVRTQGVDSLLKPILEIVPGPDAEELLEGAARTMGGGTTRLAAPVAPLSVIGFLWASSSGLHNLMDTS